ncbi:2-phospho-L-lactate transferase [soil metagenome]
MHVVVLAGGYGGAKMAHGFALEAERRRRAGEEPLELAVVGNTADDLTLHGLHVSPDLDTLMYTLAGLANSDTGWGVRDETWSAAEMLGRYGEPTWFSLGDRDLATHIVRTARLRAGERLTEVTDRLARSLGITAALLPMTDQPVATKVRTADGWLDFQDYFVRRGHADEVLELRFAGIADARPTGEVAAALRAASLVVIAPSNPFVSVGPILALPGMAEALAAAPARVVAISPIVAGSALRGPADQLLRSLAGEHGAAGVARHYSRTYPGLIDDFVLDVADVAATSEVAAAGYGALVTQTVLGSEDQRQELARFLATSE